MKWYITVAAVREWQVIAGYPREDEGPGFDDAAMSLDALSHEAELKKDEGHRQLWMARTKLPMSDKPDRNRRIELYVSTEKRPEGPLPQLVRVRLKD